MAEERLDPKITALVLIDLEHGIVGRDLAPRSGSEVVATCARLAEAFREKGAPVVYVHVLLGEIPSVPSDRPTASGTPPPAEASELVPEAGFREGDLLVTKRQWGAFHGTPLDLLLRRRGVRTIVLGGIATNMGVESTGRAAVEHGYAVVFAEDAMATMSAEMHQFAIGEIFPIIGRVRSAEEVIAAL